VSSAAVARVFREESGRILATLIRLLGDFDLAEEVMQEAFATALERWPTAGVPDNPRTWLVSAARNKAIDLLRRRTRFDARRGELTALAALEESPDVLDPPENRIDDDRLRLVFTCCHPALALDAQVALTLRTLGGLTTEEVARAFLVPVPTMAQRLVRAKHKIRAAGIPYRIPADELLPERVAAVLATVYLIFNEGYAATSGEARVRHDLTREAIRLGRLLTRLMANVTEARALLALMLLHDARRAARVDEAGALILLEDQDRARWDRAQIAEGVALAERALAEGGARPYALQAAIAALHDEAARAEATDWPQIAALYAELERVYPTAVVRLNRAVAVGMADGPAAGLALLDDLDDTLADYHLLPAARADLLRRLARWDDAAAEYRRALALAPSAPERRFLARRLAEAEASRGSPAAPGS
jgi:RNA polymerase sigma-70 factor (ECF subfamily)